MTSYDSKTYKIKFFEILKKIQKKFKKIYVIPLVTGRFFVKFDAPGSNGLEVIGENVRQKVNSHAAKVR